MSDDLLTLAESFLADPAPRGVPQSDLMRCADALRTHWRWLDAARLYKLAREPFTVQRDGRTDTFALAQEAHCTSKAAGDLGAEDAFHRAVSLLESGGLVQTQDQETLGIAGGIYKRYWDTFGQSQHLKQAFNYYRRGWQAGNVDDDGYTGINAAYVADTFAFIEEAIARRDNASPPSTARQNRDEARAIREDIVRRTTQLESRMTSRPTPWWIAVTLAEAHFGLAPYDGAHYALAEMHLRQALSLSDVPSWMIQTTARQLGAMARMQERSPSSPGDGDTRPWQVLELLVERVPALRTELGAKVGLALSGGGFRASLFHIGVLARLAEIDLLRHVEVLSCVSGGSILGAAYYLALRKLLNDKRDEQITNDDYLAIVHGLETDFLSAIQTNNFRLRMVEDVAQNLRMLWERTSRTEALGRAMGRALYGSDETELHDLTIHPPDEEKGLRPVDYNWRRKHKVPLLVLNATHQADGHAWHFTPYEMGEPQLSAIDSNPRLTPQLLSTGKSVSLWRAVTASACVPVLFEPIAVTFDGKPINLLDGGVHDNQGTSALLARDCTLLLVSDASGQLTNEPDAGTSFAAVGLRADEIVQERLRIALYEALDSRRRGSLLRGVMFLHLRLGLKDRDETLTDYGVPTGVQRRLSAIRTDLDVFNDVEALSLMLSGYLMAREQFSKQVSGVPEEPATEANWDFQTIATSLRATPPQPQFLFLLDLAGSRFFKSWRAVPYLRHSAKALGAVLALSVLALLVWLLRSDELVIIPVNGIAWSVITFLGGLAFTRYFRFEIPSWKKQAALVALALTGSAIASLHAKWLDVAYLRAGSRKHFGAKPRT